MDVYGIGTEELGEADPIVGCGDVPPPDLHDAVARRRVYVHTARWTSLGLSLLEAMFLGMPVVVVAATEAATAVPSDAGVVSADPAILAAGIREFVNEPGFAQLAGKAGRHAALTNFGIDAFSANWNRLLDETVR